MGTMIIDPAKGLATASAQYFVGPKFSPTNANGTVIDPPRTPSQRMKNAITTGLLLRKMARMRRKNSKDVVDVETKRQEVTNFSNALQ